MYDDFDGFSNMIRVPVFVAGDWFGKLPLDDVVYCVQMHDFLNCPACCGFCERDLCQSFQYTLCHFHKGSCITWS